MGIRPAYLAHDEICCGEPLLRQGNEKEFVKNALDFVNICKIRGVDTVITPCAECYRAFKINYPRYLEGFKLPEFKHLSQVLAEKLNGLPFRADAFKDVKATYQDPCRLGRDCGIYEEPRSLISKLGGIEFVEMKKNRGDAVCCGAGGGVKLTNPEFAAWMGGNRIDMAKETEASIIITACPWCDYNFRDSMKNNDNIEVKNIVDLIDEAVAD